MKTMDIRETDRSPALLSKMQLALLFTASAKSYIRKILAGQDKINIFKKNDNVSEWQR